MKKILITKINQGKSIQLTLSFCYPLSLTISLGSRTSKGVVVVTHFVQWIPSHEECTSSISQMHCIWKLLDHFSFHWYFLFNMVLLLDYTKRNKIKWFCKGCLQKLSCIAMSFWMSPTEESLKMTLSDECGTKIKTFSSFNHYRCPQPCITKAS